MEKDDEITGQTGSHYTTEFRAYDSRLGRWWSVDPEFDATPWQSPYVAFDNNPILLIDPRGNQADEPDEDKPQEDPTAPTLNVDVKKMAAVEKGQTMAIDEIQKQIDMYSKDPAETQAIRETIIENVNIQVELEKVFCVVCIEQKVVDYSIKHITISPKDSEKALNISEIQEKSIVTGYKQGIKIVLKVVGAGKIASVPSYVLNTTSAGKGSDMTTTQGRILMASDLTANKLTVLFNSLNQNP